jgi:DedD protein
LESSESHEPSYYEVALTNRQVLIAFVVLLTCLVTAFLSGVWIGRGGSSPVRHPPATLEAAASPIEPPLEQLTFFNGKEPGARTTGSAGAGATTAPPAPAAADRVAPPAATVSPTAEENATEAMRQNLDATMAANRTIPAPVTAPPPAAAAPAKPAAPARKEPAAAKPAVAGKTFVQVYSSNNGTRAREIVAQLRKGGFTVVITETPKGGGTNYRVRVGPYAERNKAEAAATRLRRDFRLDTWVTDSP